MERALYDPARGYYATRKNPVGTDGDYVTAPQISPVFGYALALLGKEFLARCGDEVCSIVDIGCGDGLLLAQIADGMDELGVKGVRLAGVDRSIERTETVAASRPEITFSTSLSSISGRAPTLVFCNELFDAFPVARVVRRGSELQELCVSDTDSSWVEKAPAADLLDYFKARRIELQEGQFADISLEWERMYRLIASTVGRGMIVTFDYGFEQGQLFNPGIRRFGTVAAYAEHKVSRNILDRPGEQDLTAHVNFSDLIGAGEAESFTTLAFTRQARFLLSLGVAAHALFTPSHSVESKGLADTLRIFEQRQAAQRLILPDGIGDEMRVLVQVKNMGGEEWSFERQLLS